MRSFAENWPEFENDQFVQQAVGKIPWGHNLVLLSKLKNKDERLAYVTAIQAHGWSRNVLQHQIENGFIERQGNATTNFAKTLPDAQSELAQQTLKDPYVFDFLSIGAEARERDLEKALRKHRLSPQPS